MKTGFSPANEAKLCQFVKKTKNKRERERKKCCFLFIVFSLFFPVGEEGVLRRLIYCSDEKYAIKNRTREREKKKD